MRLIDADALNKRKKKYIFQTVGGCFPKSEWFFKWEDVMNAPTIEAEPVVRCKECLHAMKIPKEKKKYFANGCLCCALGRGDPTIGISVVRPDDYCSGGSTCVATH